MFPAAFLASAFATWLIELAPGATLVESYVATFVSAFLFIVVIGFVAPKYRLQIAIGVALFILTLTLSFSLFAVYFDAEFRHLILSQANYQSTGVQLLGSVLAVLALYLGEPRKSKSKKAIPKTTKRKTPASSKR